MRACEVLEPVEEDRRSSPGREVATEAFRRGSRPPLRIRCTELLEPIDVGGVQASELTADLLRLDQRSLELANRVPEGVGEAVEPGRDPESPELGTGDDTPDEERSLQPAQKSPAAGFGSEPSDEVVEGADRASKDAADPGEQIALDPLDLAPIRHDQNGLVVERGDVPVEQARDLAGIRRADEQRQRHSEMLAPASARWLIGKCGAVGDGRDRG